MKKSIGAVGTTRVLGIDEISLKKRHKQFVLVISDIADIETGDYGFSTTRYRFMHHP